ncbi:TPA: hypothetical protein I7551_07750 [Vibrio cholerae]|nr:hypothetical protein [Vibrio cholerae]
MLNKQIYCRAGSFNSNQRKGESMNIKSAPSYFSYITQESDPFFNEVWAQKLKTLTLDLSWVDELESVNRKEVDEYRRTNPDWEVTRSTYGRYDSFSKDVESEDFPTFHNWPIEWQSAFEACETEAYNLTTEHVKSFDKYLIGNNTLYIHDEKEEVFFSTNSYDFGCIKKMMAKDDSFDSVLTAAYALLNDYREWEKNHGVHWQKINILSGAEPKAINDLKGTEQECDGCGAFTVIVNEDSNGNCFCKDCQ